MKKHLLFLFLISSTVLQAQNLSAYVAYNNNLNLFDEGVFSKPELNKVSALYVGFSYVAYISFDNKLKMYWKKNIHDINEASFLSQAYATKFLFAYQMGKQLKVIDKGKDRTLTNWCEKAVVTDSIAAYYDGNKRQFFIYYNGDIYLLDDVLSYAADFLDSTNASIGNNTFLYVNSYQKLRGMYRGQFFEIGDYMQGINFKAGTDIAVYTNINLTAWKAFCNGIEYTLESAMPQSFKLGNGMVAYVDFLNQFNVFYDSKKISLLDFVPANYTVVDSIISYSDNVNNWHLFYGGKSYRMLNYTPKSIKISNGTVAFIDNVGRLQVFQNGVTKTLSDEIVTSFDVNGSVVNYTLGENNYKIYWNGTTY